jgi:hypothetical protein
MKKTLSILIILFCSYLNAQSKKSVFFFIDGKKYLKPIKYVEYSSKTDRKKITNKGTYFYIKNERFRFSKKKHTLDTCNINSFKKINFSEVNKLANKEYSFYKKKIKEINYWKNNKIKPPMPIFRLHPFFKIIIVEKIQNKTLKYEVDWEKSHSY